MHISVDGAKAIADGEIAADKTVSFEIIVNGFLFNLEINVVGNDAEVEEDESKEADEEESNEDDDDEDFEDDDDDDETLKSLYRIYNFVPKKKPKLAPGEPEPIEIKAVVTEIDAFGSIRVTFSPPVAQVPDLWR